MAGHAPLGCSAVDRATDEHLAGRTEVLTACPESALGASEKLAQWTVSHDAAASWAPQRAECIRDMCPLPFAVVDAGELMRRAGRMLMRGPQRRRAYQVVNRLAKAALGARIRSGPAAGLRFRGGDTVGYILGVSEPVVQQALVHHLQEGAVLYDIGSHAGFEALLGCRLVGATGRVHCFEPAPQNIAVLRENIAVNAFHNAVVHELALSDSDGIAHMEASDRAITAHLSKDGATTVRVARLDSLDLPAPTVVKIDVEGAESAVLRGMAESLRAHHPVLIIEIHGTQEAPVRRELSQAGYATVEVLDDGGMPHLLAKL